MATSKKLSLVDAIGAVGVLKAFLENLKEADNPSNSQIEIKFEQKAYLGLRKVAQEWGVEVGVLVEGLMTYLAGKPALLSELYECSGAVVCEELIDS